MLNSIYERQTGKKGYLNRRDMKDIITYYDNTGDGAIGREELYDFYKKY